MLAWVCGRSPARGLGRITLLGLVVAACSANDPLEPSGDDDTGGSSGTSAGAGAGGTGNGPSGGAGPLGGTGPAGAAGTPAGGAGTGSGGSAGTPPQGGAGPLGGAAGAGAGAGGAGAGAGAGGSAGAAPATLVMPIQRADRYVLEFEGLVFEVNPAVGARVSSLRLDGTELLSGPSVEPSNYGSTFWTSPQNGWCAAMMNCWPPPPEVDNQAYSTSVDAENRVVSVGGTNAALGAGVAKRFSADLARRGIVIDYQISAATAKSFAPWEITRVPPNGITFFGKGAAQPPACGGFTAPALIDMGGAYWYQWTSPGGANQKLCGDGAGWIAHMADGIVIVKKWDDVPATGAAPGEGEIEIFVDGQGRYVEVENQGAYLPLDAGGMSVWTVTWYVRRVPEGLAPGSAELVAFVQSLWQ